MKPSKNTTADRPPYSRSTCICECWQVLDSNLFATNVKWVFYYNFEGAPWEIPNRSVYNPEDQPLGCKLIAGPVFRLR